MTLVTYLTVKLAQAERNRRKAPHSQTLFHDGQIAAYRDALDMAQNASEAEFRGAVERLEVMTVLQ